MRRWGESGSDSRTTTDAVVDANSPQPLRRTGLLLLYKSLTSSVSAGPYTEFLRGLSKDWLMTEIENIDLLFMRSLRWMEYAYPNRFQTA